MVMQLQAALQVHWVNLKDGPGQIQLSSIMFSVLTIQLVLWLEPNRIEEQI